MMPHIPILPRCLALATTPLMGALPAWSDTLGETERPPNMVVILADDLGYADLGVYGAPRIKTPRIDRMAEEGMRLTSFYTESLCSPTRAALLTGSYAFRVGMVRVCWPDSDYGLHPNEISLARLLRGVGYATALIGKWHLGHEPEFLPTNHGFDEFYGMPYSNDMGTDSRREGFDPLPFMRGEEVIERDPDQSTLTRRYTEATVRFMEENREKPFFVLLGHTFPHVPLYAGEDFAGRSEFGLYGDVVEELDWSTGVILDRIKELGLDRNTLVVFTSDNGPWLQKGSHGGLATPLREGKGTSWEGGHRVPAIFRWPGRIPAGVERGGIVSIMDLYPTLAGLGEATPPRDRVIDGKDIGDFLLGKTEASPRGSFVYYRLRLQQAIRIGEWKLHLEGPRRDYNHPDYDYTDAFTYEMGEALYNLVEDPGEQRNLIRSRPEVADMLREAAEAHSAEMARNNRPLGRVGRLR